MSSFERSRRDRWFARAIWSLIITWWMSIALLTSRNIQHQLWLQQLLQERTCLCDSCKSNHVARIFSWKYSISQIYSCLMRRTMQYSVHWDRVWKKSDRRWFQLKWRHHSCVYFCQLSWNFLDERLCVYISVTWTWNGNLTISNEIKQWLIRLDSWWSY